MGVCGMGKIYDPTDRGFSEFLIDYAHTSHKDLSQVAVLGGAAFAEALRPSREYKAFIKNMQINAPMIYNTIVNSQRRSR